MQKTNRTSLIKIEQYLYGTKLLADCLEVAYVSDRKGIEDRLLRPPKVASQQGDT